MTPALAPERGAAEASSTWCWSFPLAHRASESVPGREIAIAFAGRLSNCEALSRELGIPVIANDEARVAAAYARWGLDLLSHLRGGFALSIVDPCRPHAIVARDHMGHYPLFFAVHGNVVSVAPAPQTLVAHPEISRELNRAALADALCRRYPDANETFYQHVRRVPASGRLHIGGGEVRTELYWHPAAVRSTRSVRSEDEAFELFEHLQHQAVRRCLDGARTAVFLSGGLDSTSVAAVASSVAREQAPIALSLTFPGGSCDERPIQEASAAALGLPQVLLPLDAALGGDTLLARVRQLSRALPSPLMNYWRPAYLELARRGQALGAGTILTGHGGDEWLLSPIYTLADLLASGRLVAARRFVTTWARSEEVRGLVWHCGLRPLAGRVASGLAPRWWDRRRARRLCAPDPDWVAPDRGLRTAQEERSAGALGPARPAQGFASAERTYTLRGSTCQQDREEYATMGMLAGVRFHHPYHDVDLVEFCCSLPTPLLSAGGWLRGLTRRQLTEHLPGLGFGQQTKVMGTDFHRTTLRRSVAMLRPADLRFPELEALGVIDGDKLRASVGADIERAAKRIFDLSSIEAWVGAQNRAISADIVY